mgnify:FL=1
MSRTITNRMLQKLSMYLIYLKGLPEGHPEYISATMIAEGLNMGEVNVRKDLAAVTRRGCPKCGRRREELISDLENFLGLEQPVKAIHVGSPDCVNWILHKCGGYVEITDYYPLKPGCTLGRMAMNYMAGKNRSEGVKLAIVDTYSEALQAVAEQLTQNGIELIWNFSSAPLLECGTAIIQNESLLPSLGVLSGMMHTLGENKADAMALEQFPL